MAQTQVYTCDICKQSKSKDDLARITINAKGIKMLNISYGELKIDVCQDCLKKKGFVVEDKKDEELKQAQEKNKVTLEDKIYEFLSDMGVVFQGQNRPRI